MKYVSTQNIHHLSFCSFVPRLPLGLLLNRWLSFILLSILLTWPMQFSRLTLTKESISQSPKSRKSSLFYRFLQFSFTSISPHILLKILFHKANIITNLE
jgi:hypothetical protein